MSDVIYTKGFNDGYLTALEADLREVQRFALLGKSAQDCAELLEYLVNKERALRAEGVVGVE